MVIRFRSIYAYQWYIFRFDFVLHANQPVGQYMLRAQGLADCDERFKNAHQTAILRYTGAARDPTYLPQAPQLTGKVCYSRPACTFVQVVSQ